MNTWIIFGLFVCSAYIVQIIFGIKQVKHFHQIYAELRQKGRVAIGRRSGKVRSGTVILFALDKDGMIVDARKMQGVSVWTKFRPMLEYQGIEISALTIFHPLVAKEMKITRETILNAVEVYERVQNNQYVEETPVSPLGVLKNQVQYFFWKRKHGNG